MDRLGTETVLLRTFVFGGYECPVLAGFGVQPQSKRPDHFQHRVKAGTPFSRKGFV